MNRSIATWLGMSFLLVECCVALAEDKVAEPAAVVGKGYRLVWNDEFDNLDSVDIKNTGKPGFKWYVNMGTFSAKIDASVSSPEPSVMRLDHGGFPNWQLSSSYSSTMGLNLAGAEGFYVESRIRFAAKKGDLKTGWPAFWLNPAENNYGVAQWPGQTPGFINRVECDIMEYGLVDLKTYVATIHQWLGVSRWGIEPHVSNDGKNVVPFANSELPNNRWHTYGCLTVPSTKSPDGHGFIQFYLDNVATPVRVEWVGPEIGTPPPKAPHIYANFEHQHHVILLGTGKEWPMDVDWVRVWQLKPTAKTGGK
jgi:hypothetical protein